MLQKSQTLLFRKDFIWKFKFEIKGWFCASSNTNLIMAKKKQEK